MSARTSSHTTQQSDTLHRIRHSLAHLLAAAVLERFPSAKLGIGPPIADGFYYDIKFPRPVTDDDLRALETRMREFIAADLPFIQTHWTKQKANAFFAQQPFKKELIKDLPGKTVGISQFGKFTDLCRGGHVKRTGEIDAFRLSHAAGAYWRGDEKRPQLTRIYGYAFTTQKELDEHLATLEEAKKRDHKILGPQLGLFFFHETAPGMPYWLPKGLAVLNTLIEFWREEHAARGYQEISSPLVNKKELWETSGHWQFYKDDMFVADMGKGEVYGIKPMNCPNAMIVFGSTLRSYKDLPLRLSDTDMLHRHERSGTLNGLLRARSFRQDDSHNFVTEDQIQQEYKEILEIAKRFYDVFGLSYRLRLGTRPKEFLGDKKTWNRAEEALQRILTVHAGKNGFDIAEGDGAFYGPKVDILMKDALGREWQMGTIQLDFQTPRRFKLSYIDKDGQKKTPVVIHRVIYGALERFIALLIENFSGALPLWLAPVQVRLLPINREIISYAEHVAHELRAQHIRVDIDDSDEKLQKKIRTAEMEKIPVMAIIGRKEADAKSLALRAHGGKDVGVRSLTDALSFFREHIEKKSLSLF